MANKDREGPSLSCFGWWRSQTWLFILSFGCSRVSP